MRQNVKTTVIILYIQGSLERLKITGSRFNTGKIFQTDNSFENLYFI